MICMTDLKSVPSRSPSVVTRKTGNECILVPVANNIADMNSVYTLNETGAFLWELIDGENNLEDMVEALIREYDIDERTATNDVCGFINEMREYLIINEQK
jgi:Coenzyme PQQ synthesis protein D (PqqD)